MSARTRAADWVSVQGHYAGSVSRFLAFLIDVVVSAGLFALGLAAASLAAQVVTGHSVSWNRTNIVVAIILGAWEFFYFGYSWAASGRTAIVLRRIMLSRGMVRRTVISRIGLEKTTLAVDFMLRASMKTHGICADYSR